MGLILSRFAWVLVLTCGWCPGRYSAVGHHSVHGKLGSVIPDQGILGGVQKAAVPCVTFTSMFLSLSLLSQKINLKTFKKISGLAVSYSLVCFSSLDPSDFYLYI